MRAGGEREPRVAAVWNAVAERLIAGLCHDLNGAAAAISGLLEIGSDPLGGDPVVRALMAAEVERLQSLSELMRLIPSPREEVPEPVALNQLLGPVLRLFGRHADLKHERVELVEAGEAPPVLAAPAALGRAVLVLLAAAGGRPDTGGVRLGWRGSVASVVLVFEPLPLGVMDPPPAEPRGIPAAADAALAAGAFVVGFGGWCESTGGGDASAAGFELWLPKLEAKWVRGGAGGAPGF